MTVGKHQGTVELDVRAILSVLTTDCMQQLIVYLCICKIPDHANGAH